MMLYATEELKKKLKYGSLYKYPPSITRNWDKIEWLTIHVDWEGQYKAFDAFIYTFVIKKPGRKRRPYLQWPFPYPEGVKVFYEACLKGEDEDDN